MQRSWVPFLGVLCLSWWLPPRGSAQSVDDAAGPLRTQTIRLAKGWNAVHLEVDPVDLAPSEVFADLPVDIVARYFPRRSAVQFIDDPAEQDFNHPAWGVWYSPDRPDGFLTNLHAIYGNTPYLIHATESHEWMIRGRVRFHRLRWRADSFNLHGFGIDPDSPPSFATYFSGARDKIGSRIYRLVDQQWVQVTDLANTRMRAGEAYWVYCTGETNYQGPLDLEIEGVGSVQLGYGGTTDIRFRNRLDRPSVLTLEMVGEGGGRLPIHRRAREPGLLATIDRPLAPLSYFALSAHDTRALQLSTPREGIQGEPWALLHISTDAGAMAWIPVRAAQKPARSQPRRGALR